MSTTDLGLVKGSNSVSFIIGEFPEPSTGSTSTVTVENYTAYSDFVFTGVDTVVLLSEDPADIWNGLVTICTGLGTASASNSVAQFMYNTSTHNISYNRAWYMQTHPRLAPQSSEELDAWFWIQSTWTRGSATAANITRKYPSDLDTSGILIGPYSSTQNATSMTSNHDIQSSYVGGRSNKGFASIMIALQMYGDGRGIPVNMIPLKLTGAYSEYLKFVPWFATSSVIAPYFTQGFSKSTASASTSAPSATSNYAQIYRYAYQASASGDSLSFQLGSALNNASTRTYIWSFIYPTVQPSDDYLGSLGWPAWA